MKKISLKAVKNSLTRDEMRSIIGGSGKRCGACSSAYDCGGGCNVCDGTSCSTFH